MKRDYHSNKYARSYTVAQRNFNPLETATIKVVKPTVAKRQPTTLQELFK